MTNYQKISKVVNFRLPHSLNDKVDKYFAPLGYRYKSDFLEAAVREFVNKAERENKEILDTCPELEPA